MNVSKWVLIGLSVACAMGVFMSAGAAPSPASASLVARASSIAGTNYSAEKAVDPIAAWQETTRVSDSKTHGVPSLWAGCPGLTQTPRW